jgi:Arc/MetJ-type ribon-helix-helix transcriptional regulator
MSTDSNNRDKKVQLSATIPNSQLSFLNKHQQDNKYEDRSESVREAIALLQSATDGPDAFNNELRQRFGLRRMVYPANGHDYSDLIEKAESVTLVFNDMRRWLDNHRHRGALRMRIVQNRPTRIYLLHPKSNLMNFVAKISNKLEVVGGKNRQVRDVERAVRHLCAGLWRHFNNRENGEDENFRIVGHRYFNTYTTVMTENECRVVWYPIFKRYNDGVIFVFDKTGAPEEYYFQFKADIEELERVSIDNHRDSDLIKLLAPASSKPRSKTIASRRRKKKS